MNVSHLPGGSLARAVTAIQDRIGITQQEMTTGTLAEPVVELGAGRARTISWGAEADRLDRVRETNALVAGRLDMTALGLGSIARSTSDLLGTLVGAVGGEVDPAFALEAASAAREAITGALNGTFGGSHLFAGVTSDVAPIRDGVEARTALEGRYPELFPGGPATSPADAAAAMADAVDWLTGDDGWVLVSDASDDLVSARIAPGERIDASVSANERSTRQAYAAAFLAERLFAGDLEPAALAAAGQVLLGTAAQAGAGLAAAEGRLGLMQSRVEMANGRLAEDADQLRALAAETLAVDPFEAAQRFNAEVTQLETAYALTARLSQLSLMRFL